MFFSHHLRTPSLQLQLPKLHATLMTLYTQIHIKTDLMCVLLQNNLLVCVWAHRFTNTLELKKKRQAYEFSLMKQKLTFLPFVLFNRERVKKGAPYLKILPTAAAWQIFHNQSVFCTGRRTVLISSASSITISTFRRWQADSSTSTREMEHSVYTPRQKRSAPSVSKCIQNSHTHKSKKNKSPLYKTLQRSKLLKIITSI